MEISVEHKIFDQETQKQFSKWFINLLHEAYHEIKGANIDVLIESPSAFAGIHISEVCGNTMWPAFAVARSG